MRKSVVFLGLALLLAGCERVPPPTAPAQRREGRRRWPTVVQPTAAALSPDGKRTLVGFSEDPRTGGADPPEGKVAALWELETGKLAHIFGHDGGVYFVAFLPGGHALSAGGATVKRWDLETGRQVWSANAYGYCGVRAALSPDGQRLLTWGLDGAKIDARTASLKLFDVRTGKLLRAHDDFQAKGVWNMTFAPRPGLAFIAFLRASRDGVPVELLDVDTGKAVESFPKEQAWKYPLAFSPDGKLALAHRLPAGRTRTTAPLSLWDLSSGREVRVFDFLPEEGPNSQMIPRTAAFTPDGQRILTVDYGGVLRTWGVDGKELRAAPLDPKEGLNTFSADAKRLLRVSGSFRVHPWNEPPRNMRDSFKTVPWAVRVILWDTGSGKELLSLKK